MKSLLTFLSLFICLLISNQGFAQGKAKIIREGIEYFFKKKVPKELAESVGKKVTRKAYKVFSASPATTGRARFYFGKEGNSLKFVPDYNSFRKPSNFDESQSVKDYLSSVYNLNGVDGVDYIFDEAILNGLSEPLENYFQKGRYFVENVNGTPIPVSYKNGRHLASFSPSVLSTVDQATLDAVATARNLAFKKNEVSIVSLFHESADLETLRAIKNLAGKKNVNVTSQESLMKIFGKSQKKTLILVGHVEGSAFTIRDASGNKQFSIAIKQMVQISKNHDCRIIALGCNTSIVKSVSGIQGNINSLEIINQLENALQSENYIDFITAIGSPENPFLIKKDLAGQTEFIIASRLSVSKLDQVKEAHQVVMTSSLPGKVLTYEKQSSTAWIVQLIVKIVFFLFGLITVAIGFENMSSKKSINDLNEEEKRTIIDPKGYLKMVGYTFIVAGIMVALIYYIPLWWNLGWLGQVITCVVCLVIILIFSASYTDTYSSLYKKNHKPTRFKKERKTLIISSLVTVFLFLCGSYIWLFGYSSTEIRNGTISLSGAYGFTEQIQQVNLIEQLPEIGDEVHGTSFFNLYRGVFETKELGIVKLRLNSSQAPFIYIITESGIPVIVNGSSKEETLRISKEINWASVSASK
ncbi:MAG: hypothetical protein AAFQ94_19585 [Bacteroidota bacterium]